MSKIEDRFLELIEHKFGKQGRDAIEHLRNSGILHEGDARRYVILHSYATRFVTSDKTDLQIRIDVSEECACSAEVVYSYFTKCKNIQDIV